MVSDRAGGAGGGRDHGRGARPLLQHAGAPQVPRGARTELGGALRVCWRSSPSRHPEVHLAVTHDGRAVLTAPRSRTLRDRVGALSASSSPASMLEVDAPEQGIRVSGLVSPPALARASRDEITLRGERPARARHAPDPDAPRRLPAAARARPLPGGRAPDRPAAPGGGRERAPDQGVGALPVAAPRAGGALRGRAGGPARSRAPCRARAAATGSAGTARRLAERWMVAGGTAGGRAARPRPRSFARSAAPFEGRPLRRGGRPAPRHVRRRRHRRGGVLRGPARGPRARAVRAPAGRADPRPARLAGAAVPARRSSSRPGRQSLLGNGASDLAPLGFVLEGFGGRRDPAPGGARRARARASRGGSSSACSTR